MTTTEVQGSAGGLAPGRALRPRAKVLPEHARSHNRSLVLQTLYRSGRRSRADLARETGLTRVTVSDLVAELLTEGLVIELGQRESVRPGKPAIRPECNGNCICTNTSAAVPTHGSRSPSGRPSSLS